MPAREPPSVRPRTEQASIPQIQLPVAKESVMHAALKYLGAVSGCAGICRVQVRRRDRYVHPRHDG